MGNGKSGSEIKIIDPASVFALLFSACFIVALIYYLAVNFDIMPRFSFDMISRMRAKVDLMQPLPKSLLYALFIGLVAGVGGTVLALLYNIFSSIFGGVRAEIKD